MRPPQSSTARSTTAVRWQAYALASLVALAILFGGGGAEGPLNNGIIQAASAILLSLLIASHVRGTWPLPRTSSAATWVLIALLLVTGAQLLPLPQDVWRSLRGRELAEASLTLIGAAEEWRPISLEPESTRRFAASLLLPAAIFYGVLGATRREVVLVVGAAVAAAGVSAAIGMLQLILAYPGWLSYYEGPTVGAASGVFANPNHHASFLVGATLLLAFVIRAQQSRRRSTNRHNPSYLRAGWLAFPFFIVVILATGSRAGIILLTLATPGVLLIGLGRGSPLVWVVGLAVVAVVVALTVLFSPTGNALAFGHSFVFSDDSRYSFLPDVLLTLRQHWPVGSGLGTFVPVFAPNENLDTAGAGYVNHAHNDWVEWLLETGIVGAVWLIAIITIFAWRIVRLVLNRQQLRGTQVAAMLTGASILLLLGFHSLVDYPLRVVAISAVAAVAAGLIFSPLSEAPARPISRRGPAWPTITGGVMGVIVGTLVLRIFAAEAAVRQDNGALALMLRPNSADALALAAEQHVRFRNTPTARRLAAASIQQAPLNSTAVRTLAMASPPAAALPYWRIASALGWRDGPTQLWALQQALLSREYEIAAVRADAFLRTRKSREEYLKLVRAISANPRFAAALAERLKLGPLWRERFFVLQPGASDEEHDGLYEVLRRLAAVGDPATRREAKHLLTSEVRRENYDRVMSLHGMLYGPRPTSGELLADGSFGRPIDEYRQSGTLFDWLLPSVQGGTVTIDEETGRSLFVETDGSAERMLLKRYVPLEGGKYQLSYAQRGEIDSPEAITVALRCANEKLLGVSNSDPLQGPASERRTISFLVPSACPVVSISFEAKPVGRPISANFDDFSLRRVQ